MLPTRISCEQATMFLQGATRLKARQGELVDQGCKHEATRLIMRLCQEDQDLWTVQSVMMVLTCFKRAGSSGIFTLSTIVSLCQKLLLISQLQSSVVAMWSICNTFKMPAALQFKLLGQTAWRNCRKLSFQDLDHVQSSALPAELTLQAVSSTLRDMASLGFQTE